MLQPGSRYQALSVNLLAYTGPDGRPIVYLPRRTVPAGAPVSLPATVMAGPNDRLDQVATRILGDPQQFWRLCDANDAMNPFTLLEDATGHLRLPSPYASAQWSSTLAIGRDALQALPGLPGSGGPALPGGRA